MKRIVNHWMCWMAIAGLFAAGCSGINAARNVEFARSGKQHDVDFYASGAASFQPEEFWVIERNSAVANAFPLPPESTGLKAVINGRDRALPLVRMDVNAVVNGYIGAVDVTQQFENRYTQNIEAVYVFSLPTDAAVDDFVMTIGKRRIRGIIRERKDAEAIYEEAKRQGYLASLLTANQANCFRQKIANIEPGNTIDVRIHYFQTLQLAHGWYEMPFLTAANRNSKKGNVPVSLRADVNAGAAIAEVQCPDHIIIKKTITPERWTVQLSPADATPNEDLKLRYRLANGQSAPDLMTYRDERGGYFTLMLHAPKESLPLSNVKIDWGATQVSEVYPRNISNLPAGRGLLVAGRFSGNAPATVTVTGTARSQPFSFSIPMDLSKTSADKVIPKIWAVMKIGNLELQSLRTGDLQFLSETKKVALDYGLASPFTSFLAVDASEPSDEGKAKSAPSGH